MFWMEEGGVEVNFFGSDFGLHVGVLEAEENEIQNPKSEIRNPKQVQMTQNFKFETVSIFEF